MKVKEIMERANIQHTGRAVAYIKDGLEEIEMFTKQNIIRGNLAVYNASTIAFVNSNPDTLTDTANGFVTAGFKVGMKLLVENSDSNDTDKSANTDVGYYTIATVAAGTLTLIATDELTAESAGASFKLRGQSINYMDIIKDKRFYPLPNNMLKLIDVKVKNHKNGNDKYRCVERLIYQPSEQDGDNI